MVKFQENLGYHKTHAPVSVRAKGEGGVETGKVSSREILILEADGFSNNVAFLSNRVLFS